MGIFSDLHLMICLIAFIYLSKKARESTQSRILGLAIAGFVVFFIFFRHAWIAVAFFVIMFGYLFLNGFTQGFVEGRMSGAYMDYLRSAPPTMFGPSMGAFAPGSHMVTPFARGKDK